MSIKKIKTLYMHTGFKKYFFNTSWLFLHQGVRLFVGFFVGLWLARFLGPEDFGTYNYVIAYTSIFLALSKFGTDEILVKEFNENSFSEKKILTASFWLRILMGLIAFLTAILFLIFTEESNEIQNYIFICSLLFFFQSFEVIDAFNRSKIQIRKSSLSGILQLLLSGSLKVYLILSAADLKWFISIFVFDALSYSSFIYVAHRTSKQGFILSKVDFNIIKRLFKSSWPLMIVSMGGIIFTKIDLLIIGNILDPDDVGYYAASQKIVDLLTLYPSLIIMSLYTAIINAHKTSLKLYEKRLSQLSQILVIGSFLIALPCSIFSKEIISTLYSDKYIQATEALQILSFNLIFISMSLISLRWYIIEKIQHLLIVKTIFASITNITLNLWLVPILGIKGAALSSITSYFIFYFLFEAIHPRTRDCFKINCAFFNFVTKSKL